MNQLKGYRMHYYKYITRSLIGLAALLLSACGEQPNAPTATGDSGTGFAQAQQQGIATLPVIYVPAPGFAYQNEAGELTGVAVEIMHDFKRWFERYHGITMEFDFVAETDWSRMYARVRDAEGGVFGLGNVTITDERLRELQFSPAYLYNVALLITPDHIETISEPAKFSDYVPDLKPLAFAGTLHEERIRELRDTHQPNADIVQVTSNQAVIDGVAAGHYSYVDAYNYHRALEEGIELTYHPEFNLDGEQFGIIMPHSNDWSTLITAFFAAEGGYLTTQRYAQLLRAHLGDGVAEILLEAAPL